MAVFGCSATSRPGQNLLFLSRMHIPFLHHKRKSPSTTLTIAAVTLFIVSMVAVGVAADYVVRVMVLKNSEVNLSPEPLPSDVEYEVAMAIALRPFLDHLKSVDYRVQENDQALILKIDTALDTIISMRLRERNPAHLATVLVLEKWKRAVQGSYDDQANVADMTAQLLEDYPWLTGAQIEAASGGTAQ